MKGTIILILAVLTIVALSSASCFAASARCVVVEKKGDILVMDCGERSKGFPEKGRVKIKTDRDGQ